MPTTVRFYGGPRDGTYETLPEDRDHLPSQIRVFQLTGEGRYHQPIPEGEFCVSPDLMKVQTKTLIYHLRWWTIYSHDPHPLPQYHLQEEQ